MMLLLDFAVGSVNRSGGKKPHGNHSNNNTDREYLSVSNNTQVKCVKVNRAQSDILTYLLILTQSTFTHL